MGGELVGRVVDGGIKYNKNKREEERDREKKRRKIKREFIEEGEGSNK